MSAQDFADWRDLAISTSKRSRIYNILRLEPGLRSNHNESWFRGEQMLKIRRVANGEVVLTVSGQMHEENIVELKDLFELEGEGRPISLGLKRPDSRGSRSREVPGVLRLY
jgi:hypothetical protein